jgi:recombination protein RecT
MTKNLPVTMQKTLRDQGIIKRINERLGEKAGTFMTSILDLCGDDSNLIECDNNLVIKEALKAAALDLPVNKNLGFAYVIPYKERGVMKPHFQMGYKGYIQLAIRTGQYKYLNAGMVYEGEIIVEDRIKGTLEISGEKTSDKVIGYFCYMQLLNGFEKAIIWTKEKVEEHAKTYSKSYNSSSSPWKKSPHPMALKTMILQLIPKYGIMTIEMSTAMNQDMADFKGFGGSVQEEINDNANSEVIDIEPLTDKDKEEIKKKEVEEAQKAEMGF